MESENAKQENAPQEGARPAAKRLFPAAGKVFTYRNGLLDGPVRMRLPTDKEYAALSRREAEADGDEKKVRAIDLELMEHLTEGPCSLTGSEASFVIAHVTGLRCRPAEKPGDGGRLEIRAETYGGLETRHVFRAPTLAAVSEADLTTSRLREEFYDRHAERAEGYAGAVPLFHKSQAALALYSEASLLAVGTPEADDFFETGGTADATTG